MNATETEKRGRVVVRVRCEVVKIVYCEGCTVEQAKRDPWYYATSSEELDMPDWKVITAKAEGV